MEIINLQIAKGQFACYLKCTPCQGQDGFRYSKPEDMNYTKGALPFTEDSATLGSDMSAVMGLHEAVLFALSSFLP